MTEWWQAIILGLVQGITEWLPISSSGHLALTQHLLALDVSVSFDIFLHFSSILVVFFVFYQDIFKGFKGVLRKDPKYLKYCLYIIIAIIPIGILGVILDPLIDKIFQDIFLIGICFCITGVILIFSRWPLKKENSLTLTNVLIIGISQTAAILPGISRSGISISSGLMNGIKSNEISRFSFIIAIPIILGATIFKFDDLSSSIEWIPLIIAFIITFLSGFCSLKLLIRILKIQKLHYFAIYCFIIGIITLLLI